MACVSRGTKFVPRCGGIGFYNCKVDCGAFRDGFHGPANILQNVDMPFVRGIGTMIFDASTPKSPLWRYAFSLKTFEEKSLFKTTKPVNSLASHF